MFTLIEGVLTITFMGLNLGLMGGKCIYRLIYGWPKSDYEKMIEYFESKEIQIKDIQPDTINDDKLYKLDKRNSL